MITDVAAIDENTRHLSSRKRYQEKMINKLLHQKTTAFKHNITARVGQC